MALSILSPVVVRSPNWLGDAVIASPAVLNLKTFLREQPLAIAAPEKLVAFWKACPFVDRVISLPTPKKLWSTSRILARGKFKTALLFPNSLRVAAEARLAGIGQIIGVGGRGREWLGVQTVARRVKTLEDCHQKLDALHLVAACGASESEPFLQLSVQLELPLKIQSGSIVICPGAEYGPAKRWPEDYYVTLAQQLFSRHSLPIVFMGAPGDAVLGEELHHRVPGSKNLCGKTSLSEFMQHLAGARLVICNDSGAMHLAAIMGVPTVALFGSTEPRLTGPLGHSVRVMRHHVPCAPCFLRHCPLDFACMKSLLPAKVLAACEELLYRSP